MKKIISTFTMITVLLSVAFGQNPVVHWNFDEIEVERKIEEMVRGETHVPKEVFAYVDEVVSGERHDLNGKYYKEVTGVKGNAALLDGYTAFMELTEDDVPMVEDDFTIEGWIALGAYPKNHCPIFDHRRPVTDGYYQGYSLEIDALGRVFLKAATRGKNEIAMAENTIPLNEWTHIAGTYSKEEGLSVYVNGQLMANTKPKDPVSFADPDVTSVLIGKSRLKERPYGTIRPEGTKPSFVFFDGIIDELKLYNTALTKKELAQQYNNQKTNAAPELPERNLPSGPKSPKRFQAVNTTLKYYPSWDAPWAIDDNSDVVVQFDESDCKFVFWHGTSYIPNWVTENDIWFNNGFNEGWNEHGSCEPMSDKKAKYSSVKIIESNEARVVVKWRYGLVDVLGNFAFEDPVTGWGDWTNETFTIYPDMVGVREDKLLSNAPHAAHEWQESMMVMAPGQRPEDVLEYEALSLGNIVGESKTYSWEHETPPFLPKDPSNPMAQTINTKSEYKPFSILRPQDDPKIDVYAGEIRRDVSVFPWWNHWPVAPRPTDGRYAQFADRASHASLSHWHWEAYESTDRSMTKLMLNGLTNKSVEELLPLAKSWSYPAEIELLDERHQAVYKPNEKAYTISLDEEVSNLDFSLKGSDNSPIVNPAFVVENWGDYDINFEVDGKVKKKGNDLRYDIRHSVDSDDLIIWMRLKENKEVEFSISKK